MAKMLSGGGFSVPKVDYAKALDEGNNRTIFSSTGSMTSEERTAVKSGEKRGARALVAENPKRFGLVRQRAKNMRKYEENYKKAFGHG